MSMCGRESERESGNKSAHSRGRIVRKNYANEYLHRFIKHTRYENIYYEVKDGLPIGTTINLYH